MTFGLDLFGFDHGPVASCCDHDEVFLMGNTINWQKLKFIWIYKFYYGIIVLGRNVLILIESSSGPSKNTDPYSAMYSLKGLKMIL